MGEFRELLHARELPINAVHLREGFRRLKIQCLRVGDLDRKCPPRSIGSETSFAKIIVQTGKKINRSFRFKIGNFLIIRVLM